MTWVILKGGSTEEEGDPTCKSLKHPRIEKVTLSMIVTMLLTMLLTMMSIMIFTLMGRMEMKIYILSSLFHASRWIQRGRGSEYPLPWMQIEPGHIYDKTTMMLVDFPNMNFTLKTLEVKFHTMHICMLMKLNVDFIAQNDHWWWGLWVLAKKWIFVKILSQDEHWYCPKVSLIQSSPGISIFNTQFNCICNEQFNCQNNVKVKNCCQEAGLLTEAELKRLERVLEVDFIRIIQIQGHILHQKISAFNIRITKISDGDCFCVNQSRKSKLIGKNVKGSRGGVPSDLAANTVGTHPP